MERLIGRKRECDELEWALNSHRSEFVIVYGRRRVGKTFLVRRFFKDSFSFHFVGAHNKPQREQLQLFREALIRYSGNSGIACFDNWHDAFLCLEHYLESCTEARKVIFFDEMPWIDTHGSEFVDELEYFWSSWVQSRDDIFLIACGSATSWMKEKLEDNQGGLHNRITHRIYLRPFFLNECKAYLYEHGFEWDDYQILQCYMIFGGIPYYLSLLRPHLSLPQNVDYLVFRRGGDLSDEFDELFKALFSKADRYINIIKLLSSKREGVTRNDISRGTNYSGGGLSRMLRNLESCDFIESFSQFGNKKKQTLYRLSDFFTLFYLYFVDGNNSHDEQYWLHHFTDRSVAAWEGFTFEQVCLRHLQHIKKGLGISGMATEASTWRFVPSKGDKRNGAQIDLIISRADKLIHLIEMKFAESPYVITKEYERRLRERKSLFMEVTGIKRGPVITFVTPFGLAQGMHSSVAHSQLTATDLFADLD